MLITRHKLDWAPADHMSITAQQQSRADLASQAVQHGMLVLRFMVGVRDFKFFGDRRHSKDHDYSSVSSINVY